MNVFMLNLLMTKKMGIAVDMQCMRTEVRSGSVVIFVHMGREMIEVLRNIFIAVLYLFGIGLFGFFAAFAWALMIRVIRESKDD